MVTEHMRAQPLRKARTTAMETLAAVGLIGKEHRRAHQLSGGERQRVNIARALSGRPDALLVDEPTAALDHDRGAQVVDLLSEATRTFSVATLMVTHDTEFLGSAEQVWKMRDGRLGAAAPA